MVQFTLHTFLLKSNEKIASSVAHVFTDPATLFAIFVDDQVMVLTVGLLPRK